MHDTVQIQKAEQAKVEKRKRHFLPRELFQRPMDSGTWLPREGRYGDTHTHTDTFSGNYSGNHVAVRSRASLSPSPGMSKLPSRPRFWAQSLSHVRRCRPLPALGPPRQESPAPGRPPLQSAQGHLWGKGGRGAERGRCQPCGGCREPTESGVTVLRAERPRSPPRRGESGLLTPEMKQDLNICTLRRIFELHCGPSVLTNGHGQENKLHTV